jgi:anti-sigma regulatory factor (Ser/Thr protein kinase)
MVTALGLNCKPKNIIFSNLEARSKHYLERMGLFKLLGIESGIKIMEHEPSGRFIPLTQIKKAGALESFIEDVIPLLHLEPKQAQPIRYIISELTRNVFEHSQSKIGAILCAQYYKKSNTIRLGIVDSGVGIKQTISNVYTTKNEVDAIRLALSPGITGTTRRIGGTAQNVGAGLFFIKSIAKTNRDFFIIYSGKGMYKLLKTNPKQKVRLYADPLRDKHSSGNNFPYWQGTAIGVDLNLDRHEEFNNLLSVVYKVFQNTLKEKRKEYYKKRAKFI